MKNLTLFILVLLQNIVLFGQESISKEDSKFCEELVKYRDEELLSDFLKVSDDYKINYQAKIDIEKIKNDLLDDNKWQMSAAGNAFGQLMSLTKSTCVLILELLPASKSIRLQLETHKIYRLYTYGKKAEKFIKKDFEQFLFDEGVKKMLGDLNPVMTITQEILKTANNMDNLDKDWKSYKETVKDQIINLDKSIKIYEAAIIKYENDFERINKYKNFIDRYLSENCSSKPETNGDKYSYKETIVWKQRKPEVNGAVLTFMNNKLIEGSDVGRPSEGIDKAEGMARTGPDTYRGIFRDKQNKKDVGDTLSAWYYQFIDNNLLLICNNVRVVSANKPDRYRYDCDTLSIGSKLTPESLPPASKQPVILQQDSTTLWTAEINMRPFHYPLDITPKGDILMVRFGNYYKVSYKKSSLNTYEYKSPNGGIGRLVFLSPTLFCVSFVYKNYVSLAYYNKGSAPIVKQENKPAPVTENKTASSKGSVSGKWYIGYFHLGYTADYSVDVEEVGDNLTIKFSLEPNPELNSRFGFMSGKIVTAKKTSPYTGQYTDVIGAPVWKGTYPAEGGGMAQCSWLYNHWDGDKEMLVIMHEAGNWKLYKKRHSTGY